MARTRRNVFPDLEPPTRAVWRCGPARSLLPRSWASVSLNWTLILGPIFGDRQPELLGFAVVAHVSRHITTRVNGCLVSRVNGRLVNSTINGCVNRGCRNGVDFVLQHRFEHRLERRRNSCDLLGLRRHDLLQRFDARLQAIDTPRVRRFSAPYA